MYLILKNGVISRKLSGPKFDQVFIVVCGNTFKFLWSTYYMLLGGPKTVALHLTVLKTPEPVCKLQFTSNLVKHFNSVNSHVSPCCYCCYF